jgi:hypothetical protein
MKHRAQNENCHLLSTNIYFSFFPLNFKVLNTRKDDSGWWGNYENMFSSDYPGRQNSNWGVGLTIHWEATNRKFELNAANNTNSTVNATI